MLETGLLHGASANQFLQAIKADGFGYVELKQDKDGPAQQRFDGRICGVRHTGLILLFSMSYRCLWQGH
jgi:hypothetical protein